MGKLIELDIHDLAFDGKSVAHLDGKVVFCNAGLPGERVLAEITRSKPRYSQAIVRELITRSPERIDATCSHFDYCGGCTWQDLDYTKQLEFKHNQVVACLARLGGAEDVPVAKIIGSSQLFRYRNKMEFSFSLQGDDFTLGLHHRGRFDEVFDLEACFLQSENANRIVHYVRDFARAEKLPAYDVMAHTGYLRFLVIRETARTGEVMVNLVTNYGDLPQAERFAEGLRYLDAGVVTVLHSENGGKSNVATAENERLLWGPGYIEEEIGGMRFRISSGSFFQTNSVQAEVLYQTAFDLLQPKPDDRLMDLYCGTGTIGILCSKMVSEVVGVELVPEAVVAANENAKLNGVTNARFLQASVQDFLKVLPEEEQNFDVVIIDPPRAGLHPKALKRLINMRPPKLLYISCNPATFARDTKTLRQAGYVLPEVRPVDMFPHTRHIELVGLFHQPTGA